MTITSGIINIKSIKGRDLLFLERNYDRYTVVYWPERKKLDIPSGTDLLTALERYTVMRFRSLINKEEDTRTNYIELI
jgi:hypothetical protein